MNERERVAAERDTWENEDVAAFARRRPERREDFQTFSGETMERLYTPADVQYDYDRDLGFPGRYPFTRGPYPTMYRAQPWTMRQIAGYGTAADTNERFRFLIAQGQTGISVDFDMPTLMGYDSDDPRSEGEVGREGVAIDTLDDLDVLFRGIELDKISVSMTINPTAWILMAMYVALAQERGIPLDRLAGTVQNDIIKEYVAQKEWIFPPRPAMRIVRDSILYSTKHMPHYNPVNVSGYHIREAGSTAAQEVAFTLAAGKAYVEEVIKAGGSVDDFAPRLSFFFVSQIDFLEEVAKFRAARRIWARTMKEKYGAKKAESMRLRFHTQTAGASCTAREPLNNIVRTTIEALAAVLGGTQSLHTNGYDEALSIPSETAMRIALRTQQIILEESGVAGTIDPLAGSYAVEVLTDRIEQRVNEYFDQIEERGGVIACVEESWLQQEIANAAFDLARKKDAHELEFVGVTKYRDDKGKAPALDLHTIDPAWERNQLERLRRTKAERDQSAVASALERLVQAARDENENLIPYTVEAVKARVTGGEIVNALVPLFGRYKELAIF
ncbi:methylmalonyl-CoA mutase [bacterium]|nr:MAG: methylmalonyl-CoA mutase [bacterium]